jgi:hypothetical protein
MDLQAFKAIAPKLDAELDAVFQRYGLKTFKRSASIDSINGQVHFRLVLNDTNLKDAAGNATTPEAEFFKKMAAYYDLKPEWLGRTFKLHGKTFTVKGLRSGRAKKTVMIEGDGGKRYVIEPSVVKTHMSA